MKSRAQPSEVFRLRFPKPLLEKISKIAKDEDRTTAYMVRELVEQGLIRRAEVQASR